MYGENEEENVILVSLNSSLLNDFLREHIKLRYDRSYDQTR